MARTVMSAALMLAMVAAPVLASDPPDLEGVFAAEGEYPDGIPYRGAVQVVRHGDSFLVAWLFAQTSEGAVHLAITAVGIGLLEGDVLAVSYHSPFMSGVMVYRLEENGRRLVGRWVVAGEEGTVYFETLTRISAPPDYKENEHAPERKPSTGQRL